MRYEPNPLFHKEVEAEIEFRLGIRGIAQAVAKLVQAAAPFRTGYYKLHVKALADGVVADDSFWHWIEFGSVHNTPRAPMRRGFRAAGLRLVVNPKP
jgi:hypothetical protein